MNDSQRSTMKDCLERTRKTEILPRQASAFQPTTGSTTQPGTDRPADMTGPSRIATARHLVLMVEDDLDLVALIQSVFEEKGIECLIAQSGLDAWKVAQRLNSKGRVPSLLLLDLNLPDLTGFDLLDQLREHPDWTEIPCVFWTAIQDPDVVRMTYEKGAHDYLSKPISPTLLAVKIQSLLKRIEPAKEAFSTEKFQPGYKIDDRYQILRKIGEGGMANIYLVDDLLTSQRVALKLLLPVKDADKEETQERFRREIQVQIDLQHPNMLCIHNMGLYQDLCYYTMDYLPGGSLYDRMQQGPLTPRDALSIAIKLASVLEFIHDHGILHRDVKPENVMFGENNQPILMDFGLVLRTHSDERRLTRHELVIGTPYYLSPERILRSEEHIDERSDIYALGILLYEMVVGFLPHSSPDIAEMFRAVKDGLPAPHKYNAKIPKALSKICLKAIQFLPKKRYKLASAMVKDMKACLAKLR